MAVWDDPKLQEIRERRTEAETEWNPILEEARKDRMCVAGKPWHALDPKGQKAREDAGRPFLSLDELGQFINQTVNDVRANPRGIRYAPTGHGANDKGAEFYQAHTREIEYRSHARIADSTAFEQAVTSSVGWLRIRTKREHPRTFNQDIWVEPIMNADQVLPSPGFVWPDARDIKYLFYLEPWSERDFAREFPQAEIKSFAPEFRRIAPSWLGPSTVQVAEYWSLVTKMRTLVAFMHKGQLVEALVDELPDGKLPLGVENLREEEVDDQTVYSCLTNGIEILRENKWLGKYIPFVSCTGKSLYINSADQPRQILSMTRLARDPYMLYCYIRTCEAEAIGGVPRSQWVGYKGQFADPERWEKANIQPVAFTEALERTELTPPNGILPLPQRQPWDPPLQNLEIAAESARRAIQSAMGITPLPTEMQRQNQKLSGRAVDRVNAMGQRGSFHFVDHYELMIERRAVIIEDLIDKTLDGTRQVPIRKPDDSGAVVWINDPQNPDSISTKGSYRVTISTGPATDSQREEAADFVDAMVSNLQTVAQLSGPMVAAQVLAKSIKLKQLGPIGDEIVDLLSPQQLGEDGKPLPPEVARLMGENQQLKQLLQQAAQEKQGKLVEQEGKFRIVQVQEQAETQRAAQELAFAKLKLDVESEVKLSVAALGAKVDRLALLMEQQARLADHVHDDVERTKDRIHERVMADRRHDQALEQGDQGVAGQLAVQSAKPPNGSGASA